MTSIERLASEVAEQVSTVILEAFARVEATKTLAEFRIYHGSNGTIAYCCLCPGRFNSDGETPIDGDTLANVVAWALQHHTDHHIETP